MRTRKGVLFLLTVAVLLAALPIAAHADSTAPDIILGAAGLPNGAAVWYGTYNGSPVQWRVLGGGNDGGNASRLLLSEYVLNARATTFNSAKYWCRNFYSSAFTSDEQAAIIKTSRQDAAYTNKYHSFGAYEIKEEYAFFLSAQEAETLIQSAASRKGYTQGASDPSKWWLRSTIAGDSNGAADVDEYGYVNVMMSSSTLGARPAMNLNLHSVLFSSAAAGGKSPAATGGGLSRIENGPNTGWKLTLLDSSRTFAAHAAEGAVLMRNVGYEAWAMPIRYENARTESGEKISVLLCRDGAALYYGQLVSPAESGGTAEVTIPAGLDEGSYTLQVFNEHLNGDNLSDISSAFSAVNLTIVRPPWSGSGTEADPWLIQTAGHWETLGQFIADGAYDTAEKVFRLDAPLHVTTMIGTAGNPFRGTFDGAGHTLTVNLTATASGKGPFAYVSDAIFKHLRVAGTIRTNVNDTGGLVGQAAGSCAITDCVSGVEIVVNGGSGHAGFVGSFSGNVAIAGSLFTGHIGGSGPRYCAGFVGKGGGTVDDSIYDGGIDSGGSENNTFLRQRDYAANCYYLNTAGIQRIKGKQGFSVAAGPGVTLDFGEPKAVYPTSGITAYPTGLVYDGVFYAGPGETVSLLPGSAAPEGQYANYVTDAGFTLRRGDRAWFLDMQDRNAVIRAEFADLPTAFGAPDVILPSRLMAIGADAFAKTAAKAVRVPDECRSIGDRAFRDSAALREIRIPAGCALGEDVFTGCLLVFVFGKAGSPAEAHCQGRVNTIFIPE